MSVKWQFAAGELEREMTNLEEFPDAFSDVVFEPAEGADQLDLNLYSEIIARSFDEALSIALTTIRDEARRVNLGGEPISVWATDDIREVTRTLDLL